MNEQTSTLIALGASAATNCRPCLDHHLSRARHAGNTEEDIDAAIQVGLGVAEGARSQTAGYVSSLLHREPAVAGGGGCVPGTCC